MNFGSCFFSISDVHRFNCDVTFNRKPRLENHQKKVHESNGETSKQKNLSSIEGDENLTDDLNLFLEIQKSYDIIPACDGTKEDENDRSVDDKISGGNLTKNMELPSESRKAKEKLLNKVKYIEPQQCSICMKMLTSRYSLRQHIREVHVKQFGCDYCSMSFYLKSDLVRHIGCHIVSSKKSKKIVFRTIEKQFKCEDENCGKSFLSSYNLKRHKKQVHDSEC